MPPVPNPLPPRRTGPRRAFLLATVLAASFPFAGAGADVPSPSYRELRDLVRKHVPTLPEAELDAAAAEALLAKVRGRLLGPGEVADPPSSDPALASRSVLEGCAYVRVGQVTLGLAPQLAAALAAPEMASVRGLVLDLRGAGGTDYRAAANVVDLFLEAPTPLLAWGDQTAQSTAKTNAWTRPVAVLVNHDTRGAAEAVAAALRQQRLGILLGAPTAGVAAVFREVPLPGAPEGRRLRLAVGAVRTGGGQPLPTTGVEPDIRVKVQPDQERAYLADPYTEAFTRSAAAGASTNSAFSLRRRTSEAELVRQKREVEAGVRGGTPAMSTNGAAAAPIDAPKVLRDPVLGRAVDLLKGLTLLDGGKP